MKMSTCVSKSSFQQLSSSIKIEEEAPKVTIEKQGIVSILASDCQTTKAAASLRRTLSADMSSKKWLAQNGFTSFSPMKKIASSEELAISAAHHHSSSSSSSLSSEGEEEYYEELKRPGQDDVWRSIQSQKEKKEQPDVWTWGSILVQKNEDSSQLPPPYVHPLMRRSGSSLSEKSLEICTESLGSETGSDGFSSYPPSEVGDVDEEKENDHQQPQAQQQQPSAQSYEDMRIVKYNYSTSRKVGPRSFPPPLPSLAREDRASVHMHSYRENGRLVLEAVSVPPQNYFQAQREGGRLRLTFINTPSSQEEEMEDDVQEFEPVFDNFEEIEGNEAIFDDQGDEGYEEDEEEEEEVEEEEEEEEEEGGGKVFEIEKGRREVEFVMEQQSSKLSSGLMDAHKPTFMMKKLMGLDKKNLAWPPRFNKAVNLMGVEKAEVEDELTPSLPQSLPVPPPPRVARLISAPPATTAATSLNAYEYFWKEKPTMASIIKPMSTEQCQPLKNNQNKVILASNLSLKGYEQQNLVVMRGNKAEYLVPLLRRCKETRARSLLLWEPYCIATS